MEDEETGLLVEEPYEQNLDSSINIPAYNELEAERRKQASLGGRIHEYLAGK